MTKRHLGCFFLVGAAITMLHAPTQAAAQDDADDVGFDDGSFSGFPAGEEGDTADDVGFGENLDAKELEDSKSPWSFTGRLKHRSGLWTQRFGDNPFAMARQSLVLSLRYDKEFVVGTHAGRFRVQAAGYGEYDFAYLYDRTSYARSTLDAYEYQVFPRETYASLSIGAFDASFGWNILNWGRGEVLSLLDVVNPRDYREPGITDPEDLRLAVLSSQVGLQLDRHRLEVVAVHQPWFGLFAPPLGTFSPLRKLVLDTPLLAAAFDGRDLRFEHRPGTRIIDGRSTQAIGRWSMSTPVLDMAWMIGSVLEPLGVPGLPEPAAFEGTLVPTPLYHPRYEFVGWSGVLPWRSLLFRWELKVDFQRPLALRRLDTDVLEFGGARRDQVGGMIGLTYVAERFDGGIEVTRTAVLGGPLDMEPQNWTTLWPIDAPQLAIRGTYRFLRDRASLQLIGLVIGVRDWNAALARAQLTYKLTDDLEGHIGAIFYLPSEAMGLLYGFDRHDRVFAGLRWEFGVP